MAAWPAAANGAVAEFAAIAADSLGQAQGEYSCAFFSWHRRFLLAYESYLRELDDRFACLTTAVGFFKPMVDPQNPPEDVAETQWRGRHGGIQYGVNHEVLDAIGGVFATAAKGSRRSNTGGTRITCTCTYHLCRTRVPLHLYDQIIESPEVYANATQLLGVVHPTLGRYFGYVGSDSWNYADIQQPETTLHALLPGDATPADLE
uniref:Tyrosinase copper-binding domain-containing protein n=1 Tax=Peronospora matthiolae TaxID=2874970 RepID=A0AAV1VIX2_9STRA